MNTPAFRLYVLIALLFAALIVQTSRWTVFEAEALRDNELNRRELLEEQRIRRGPIRARDGTVIARSVEGRGKTFSRRYPLGALFGHPVGYSFIDIGRYELEQSRNDELTGERDDVGSIIDQLSGREREGDELRTTLDVEAQRIAFEALGDQRGAVVALEPQTGRIRVMASNPSFDPDALRRRGAFKELSSAPGSPLLNRATAGRYPPGSTFKVVTAVAAIDSGKFTKDSVLDGSSPQTISGAPLQNFGNADYGQVPLTFALTKSVNTVWAQVGVDLGAETMQRYMERFGFYDRAEVDLPNGQRTRSGVYKRSGLEQMTDDSVDVGRVAIGQGDLLASPLQMAMVASAVANDGVLMKPTLSERTVDRDGRTVESYEPDELRQVMRPETAREVGDMMASVVREGTGTAAALAGFPVAGKTGTAELNVEQGINQPWFIGFAPRDNPRIAIAVSVENSSGTGGEVAAPIAKRVMEALLQ
ncbi:MAG: penicillin-binding transpeptidase domain-containing protein [Actinomycetota bacterium]|nr:penicillin-binding transpeptidase domain-containing protein [Actinomycetota bacterium]MDQ5807755.1 penicillin-binding transpeptidase domain-containing protein [Actinomycetota bacterium]